MYRTYKLYAFFSIGTGEGVMGKYEALGRFLRRQPTGEIPMTFAEVERITGTKLPPSAHKHRPWWSNNPQNSVMTKVWLEAGFETQQVDMAGRKLVFRRVRKPGEQRSMSRPISGSADAAGARHHPLRGALKGLVKIMPGTDLTQPADPSWADLLDEAK
jgi:hypothetical protein